MWQHQDLKVSWLFHPNSWEVVSQTKSCWLLHCVRYPNAGQNRYTVVFVRKKLTETQAVLVVFFLLSLAETIFLFWKKNVKMQLSLGDCSNLKHYYVEVRFINIIFLISYSFSFCEHLSGIWGSIFSAAVCLPHPEGLLRHDTGFQSNKLKSTFVCL